MNASPAHWPSPFILQDSSFGLLPPHKRIRRPRSGQRKGHAFAAVALRQRLAKLDEARFLIAVDEHIDLRKRAGALLPGLRYGVAGQLVAHGALDFGHDLLLGLARGALLLVVELLA